MALLEHIWATTKAPAHVKLACLERIREDPGVPQPKASESFWLADKHPQFASEPAVPPPKEAFCVIIGSGITGASVARNIVRTRQGPERGKLSEEVRNGNVVMLDARDVVGGATGRNGGHVNEVGYSDYAHLKATLGKEVALRVMRFRLSHLKMLSQMAVEEGLTEIGQVRKVTAESVVFGKEGWEEALKDIEVFKQDFGHEADEWKVVPKEDLKKHGCETADGIITNPAGAAWPYRLLTSLLANLTKDDDRFSVFPFTPVTQIQRPDSTGYLVVTPRGIIRAKHVLHCTNSHVSHHLPGLRARIMPLRGQMSAQAPPPTFDFRGDDTSWSFNYNLGFDYLTQLPKNTPSHDRDLVEGGEMMFGGGVCHARRNGLEELGAIDDSVLNATVAQHLSTTLNKAFTCTNGEQFVVKSMWTGIMAFSTDNLPWVGRVPESVSKRETLLPAKSGEAVPSGEWVAAGYSGEGMVQAWGCGKALSMMVMGLEEQMEGWFPKEFYITEERVKKHAFENHVKVPEGAVKL